MGVASLVLGIISLLISIFSAGTIGWLGALLAILGIVFGAIGRKNPEKKGLATAGMVISIISASLGLLMYIACVACAAGTLSAFS